MTADDVLKREARFRQIAETIAAVFWLADAVEPKILYVSPAYEQVWGRDRERLYTHFEEFFETIHPDDRERVRSAASHCVLQEQFETEYRIVRPDGELRWVRDRGFLIRDQTGLPYQIAGFAEDVTEAKSDEIVRKQAEATSHLNRDRLAFVLRTTEIGLWLNSFPLGDLNWDERTKALFFIPPDVEPTIELFWSRVHPDDREPTRLAVEAALRDRTLYEIDHRAVNPNTGEIRWIRSAGKATYAPDGTPVRFDGINYDITARKQAEANLAFLAEISQDLVWLTNIDETMDAIGEKIGRFFGVKQCMFAEHADAFEISIVTYGWNAEDAPNLKGTYRTRDFLSNELMAALMTGESLIVSETQSDARVSAESYGALGIRSFIIVPLVRDREWRFQISIIDNKPREWRDDEIELMCELTTRIWTWLERTRAESALSESEAKYRLLFTSINEGYALCELLYDDNETPIDWRILEVNPAFESLTGLTDAAGKTARELDQPLNPNWLQTFGTVVLTGEDTRFEHHVSGTAYWFEISVSRIDADKHHIVVVFNNISDRKQAEQEREHLLAREQQYAAKLRALNQAAIALNAALTLEEVLNVVTQQAYQMIGTHQAVINLVLDGDWSQTQTIAHLSDKYAQWREYDAQPDGTGIYAMICQINQSIRMTQAQLEAHPRWRGFGEEAQNHPPLRGWLAAPLAGRDGQMIGLIQLSDKYEGEFSEEDEAILVQLAQMAAIAVENARLYEAEQQARAAAETAREAAEAANRIKDEFLAVLSHELRSPLNPILGWSKLLQQGKLDAARTKTAVDIIERNAQLQSQLINDLLDISRILRGKLSLNELPVDLSVVITTALETVRLAAEAKSLQIETTVPKVRTVIGDAGRLQQVVWNLLSNAVKFTPHDGQITVALTQSETHAQIQVADTGKGINPDFLPYVFEHFRQEDGATTRKFGGLGLGLAIARQIVEMHGGQISVDSPGEEQGATFTVQFPLAPLSNQIPSSEPASASTSDLSGINIFVVDDEPDSRDFVAFVLEQAGANVTRVASGIEALQAIERSIPDLIVSDIGMPEMDGYIPLLRNNLRGGCSSKIEP